MGFDSDLDFDDFVFNDSDFNELEFNYFDFNDFGSWSTLGFDPTSSPLQARAPLPINDLHNAEAILRTDARPLECERLLDVDAAFEIIKPGLLSTSEAIGQSSTVLDLGTNINLLPQPEHKQFPPSFSSVHRPFLPNHDAGRLPVPPTTFPNPPTWDSLRSALADRLPSPPTITTTTTPSTHSVTGLQNQGKGTPQHVCQRGCSKRFWSLKDIERHYKIRTHISVNVGMFRCRCGYSNPRKDHYQRHLNKKTQCKFRDQYLFFQCVCRGNELEDDKQRHRDHVAACVHGQRQTGRPRKGA